MFQTLSTDINNIIVCVKKVAFSEKAYQRRIDYHCLWAQLCTVKYLEIPEKYLAKIVIVSSLLKIVNSQKSSHQGQGCGKD